MGVNLETKIYFGILLGLALTDLTLASWVMVKAGPGTDCRCKSHVFAWMIGNLIQFSLYVLFLLGQVCFDTGGHKRMTIQVWNILIGSLLIFTIGWTCWGWYVVLAAENECCELMWRCALACVIISTGQSIVGVLTALPPAEEEKKPVLPTSAPDDYRHPPGSPLPASMRRNMGGSGSPSPMRQDGSRYGAAGTTAPNLTGSYRSRQERGIPPQTEPNMKRGSRPPPVSIPRQQQQ
mmetsp:Transcript_21185/g.46519  ORF Transcript_21185/g.46519 Transcript_21185/m.46519 type:complete len:236 (+) Transcript_21185:77-784(+)|eukprot:CAMPEP_0204252526 /NCGR_PEP_ID=MMETSP0468-20130131/1236_1 /ASSEMBLY_ACC=CAM_ASM_000383 /TAXON_ID=2969 /ORGANISM="Oxyrrhis marina" /LENGTH=235 /DNA_ID=CAMNT_0051225965 /DNA_START=77 /DNA_END=784 /DNA_ORIENTATION=+